MTSSLAFLALTVLSNNSLNTVSATNYERTYTLTNDRYTDNPGPDNSWHRSFTLKDINGNTVSTVNCDITDNFGADTFQTKSTKNTNAFNHRAVLKGQTQYNGFSINGDSGYQSNSTVTASDTFSQSGEGDAYGIEFTGWIRN